MIGWINLSVQGFITDTFGKDKWELVLEKSGVDPNWVSTCPYSDDVTYNLVLTGASLLGVTPEQALEAYGNYFVKYVHAQGYTKMLRCLGSNLPSFLQSLNDLHLHLSVLYKNMVAPIFRCDKVTPTSLELHYHSDRPGLWPIVVGVLKGIGPDMFGQEVELELVESKAKGDDHEVFRISYPYSEEIATMLAPKQRQHHKFTPNSDLFTELFPFHMVLDSNCKLIQCGETLARLMPGFVAGEALADHFHVDSPICTIDFENIAAQSSTSFKLSAITTRLAVKGQMVQTTMPSDNGCPMPRKVLLFLGSPRLANLDALNQYNLSMADLPLHDITRDFVLLAEQRQAEADLKERFETLTVDLQLANDRLAVTSRYLEDERSKSDALLYSMLPSFAAEKLRSGLTVEATDYPEVAILFSDIVGFTEISSKSSPREVCAMLNELYMTFDAIIAEYPTLYKVETIGDAYMVVSNVVQHSETHADDILNFAIRMQQSARQVKSSLGDPINIRVGIHAGSTVGSVVGKKMPRFCFFGDTVNTASRMESHGLPGKIHISGAAYQAIKGKDMFAIQDRGIIQVKGKGMMQTYLIATDESDFADVTILASQGRLASFTTAISPAQRQEIVNAMADSTNASSQDAAIDGFSISRQPSMIQRKKSTVEPRITEEDYEHGTAASQVLAQAAKDAAPKPVGFWKSFTTCFSQPPAQRYAAH